MRKPILKHNEVRAEYLMRNNLWTLHARWNGILKVFKTSATYEEYLAADRHVQTLKGVPPCLNNLTEGGECWVAPLPEPTEGK